MKKGKSTLERDLEKLYDTGLIKNYSIIAIEINGEYIQYPDMKYRVKTICGEKLEFWASEIHERKDIDEMLSMPYEEK